MSYVLKFYVPQTVLRSKVSAFYVLRVFVLQAFPWQGPLGLEGEKESRNGYKIRIDFISDSLCWIASSL